MNKDNRWLYTMALVFGLIMFLGGIFLFSLNTYYSALGMIELTYGKVEYIASILLPTARPIDGGRLGLLFGIIFGLIANAFQFVSIILRDKDINKGEVVEKKWLIIGDIFFRTYDYISTYWYLSNGLQYLFSSEVLWYEKIGQTLIFLIISILGISTGSEIFLALGLRIIYKYGRDGFLEFMRIYAGISEIIKTGLSKMSTFGGDDNDKPSKEKPRGPQIPFINKKKPGRPPKSGRYDERGSSDDSPSGYGDLRNFMGDLDE